MPSQAFIIRIQNERRNNSEYIEMFKLWARREARPIYLDSFLDLTAAAV